jgi:hypothetical protein
MTRILLVGYDPDAVDFSDPALPPGMTAEKIRAGIAAALKQFAARGWEADVGFIRPDETAGPTVERLLAATSYDCVVIGAGVRLPPRRVAVFEAVINAVHKAAPAQRLPSIRRPRIAQTLPPDGYRLEADPGHDGNAPPDDGAAQHGAFGIAPSAHVYLGVSEGRRAGGRAGQTAGMRER